MISAGTSPPIWIDLGKDEPGMVLQCYERHEWVTVIEDGRAVKSPVEKLPAGKYRLVKQPHIPRQNWTDYRGKVNICHFID